MNRKGNCGDEEEITYIVDMAVHVSTLVPKLSVVPAVVQHPIKSCENTEEAGGAGAGA